MNDLFEGRTQVTEGNTLDDFVSETVRKLEVQLTVLMKRLLTIQGTVGDGTRDGEVIHSVNNTITNAL